METIIIPTNKGLQCYNTSNIVRIQGNSNYCKIYFADSTYPLTIAKVLLWFEQQLPVADFWRTHKAHLVNSQYVKQILICDRSYLLLLNGEAVLVSRRKGVCLKKHIIPKANSILISTRQVQET